ncbi:MAG: hypothetical protein ACE37N_18080, partial [Pseudohongiellaceae bacterium]
MPITVQRLKTLLCAILLICAAFMLQAQEPHFIDPALDASYLSQLPGSTTLDPKTAQIVRFRNWAELYPARQIRRGDQVRELPHQATDFSDLRYE